VWLEQESARVPVPDFSIPFPFPERDFRHGRGLASANFSTITTIKDLQKSIKKRVSGGGKNGYKSKSMGSHKYRVDFINIGHFYRVAVSRE
jgi:hypothetical protein